MTFMTEKRQVTRTVAVLAAIAAAEYMVVAPNGRPRNRPLISGFFERQRIRRYAIR